MDLNDFNYELHRELIAQEPASPRSSSKLLIAEKNIINGNALKKLNLLRKLTN